MCSWVTGCGGGREWGQHTPRAAWRARSPSVLCLCRDKKPKKKKQWNQCGEWLQQIRRSFSLFSKHFRWIVWRSLVNHVLIKSDLTVVLLIDVQVLHQALVQKVFKVSAVRKSAFQKWWKSRRQQYLDNLLFDICYLETNMLQEIFQQDFQPHL